MEVNPTRTSSQSTPANESPDNQHVTTVETQTETFNTHSDSICCLNSIPYVDQSISPPVVHRVMDYNHVDAKISSFDGQTNANGITSHANSNGNNGDVQAISDKAL
jgi:hypothetical protein